MNCIYCYEVGIERQILKRRSILSSIRSTAKQTMKVRVEIVWTKMREIDSTKGILYTICRVVDI